MLSRLHNCICTAALILAFAGAASAQDAGKRFVITEFGAVGDATTVNTKAIQTLIDRAASQGGGTVVVPAGTFLTGSIFFKQGVNLHLEKDAILKGTNNAADYPPVPTRWEGNERTWTAALVNFFDMTGPKLTGEGMIDGSGTSWPAGARGARGRGATTAPAAEQARGQAPATTQPRYGRPRMIAFQNCKDAVISGINMKDQSSWGLFVLYSQNVRVENLTIRAAHTIPSSDGIDIDSSKNVLITGCSIDCNDDCIAIKSGKDEDGRRVNRPCEDVIVEKTTFAYGHGGVSMGSEVSGGIRNIEIRDCVVEAGNWAPIRFKSQPSRGGVVENITYRNIVIKEARQAFEFNMEWRMVPPIAPPAPVLTKVRNVKIINVDGTTNSAGIMHGLPGSPIDGVAFEDCDITARTGLRIDNAINVDTKGLKLTVQQGEPVIYRASSTAPAENE
jgi:polygalacturonase